MARNKAFAGQSFVSNDGVIATAKDADEAERYSLMGYRPATTGDIRHDEIRKVYDGWQGAVAAFGNGVVDAIPFAQTATVSAIGHYAGDQAASDYAQQHDTLAEVHPYASIAGSLAGGTAMLGMPGTQIMGATGLKAIAQGAGINMALGTANRVDRAALAHAVEPGGEEKVWAHAASDLLFDGLIGAGAGALPALAKKFGSMSEGLASSQWRQGMLDAKTVEAYAQQGRSTQFGQVLDQYAVYGETPAKVRAKIAPEIENLGNQYNAMKSELKDFRMGPNQSAALTEKLGTILGESQPEAAKQAIASLLETGNAPNIGELHSIRQKLDSAIDFTKQSEKAFAAQQPLFDAREAVSDAIAQHLGTIPGNGGAAAQTWQMLDRDYSNLQLLNGGLRKGEAASVAGAMGKIEKPFWLTAMAHTLGLGPAGKLFMAYKSAQSAGEAWSSGAFAKPAAALAGMFNSTADTLAKATSAGLMGAAAETTAIMHSDMAGEEDYDLRAAQIQAGVKDTVKTSGNLMKAATASGMPDDMTQMLTAKAIAANQFLSAQLPKNPAATFGAGLPSNFRPPAEIRRKWIGQYNTMADPSYGLLNPTAENMQVLQQFYPQTLQQARDAITAQIQTNAAGLPMAGQVWASRVMGAPVGGLMQPMFYQALNGARQSLAAQAQMQGQSGSQSPAGNGNSDNVDSSELTKVQSLQQGK